MGGLRLNSFSGFCCAVIEVVVSLKATRQSPQSIALLICSTYDVGMPEEYSKEDLQKDLDFLFNKGLIEVGGITEDGQWLYRATNKTIDMTKEEREAFVISELEDE